jgi:phosphoglucosamine mutase
MVMAVIGRKGKTLSELAANLVAFPQKLVNIKVSHKPPLESIEPLKKAIEQKEKELGDRGRVLVRYSGTENKARVMVECEDEDACKRHAHDLAQILEREIGAV